MIAKIIDKQLSHRAKTLRSGPRQSRSYSPQSPQSTAPYDDSSDSDTESDSSDSSGGYRPQAGGCLKQDKPAKRHHVSAHRYNASQLRMRTAHQNKQDGSSSDSTGSDGESSDGHCVHNADPYAALEQFAVKSTQQQLEPFAAADKYTETIAEISQLFENGDKLGASIQESFSLVFDSGLCRQPNDKQLLNVIEKYPGPQNVPGLIVPKTNDAVLKAMKRGAQIMDAGIQKIQTVLSKALVPVIEIVDKIDSGQTKGQRVADFLTDVVRLSSVAFSLLSQTRKDLVRNELGYPMSKLCNWMYKVGADQLFEDDLLKKLRELKEQGHHFRNPRSANYSNSRFGRGQRPSQDWDSYKYDGRSRFKKYRGERANFGKKFNKKKHECDCEYDVSDDVVSKYDIMSPVMSESKEEENGTKTAVMFWWRENQSCTRLLTCMSCEDHAICFINIQECLIYEICFEIIPTLNNVNTFKWAIMNCVTYVGHNWLSMNNKHAKSTAIKKNLSYNHMDHTIMSDCLYETLGLATGATIEIKKAFRGLAKKTSTLISAKPLMQQKNSNAWTTHMWNCWKQLITPKAAMWILLKQCQI